MAPPGGSLSSTGSWRVGRPPCMRPRLVGLPASSFSSLGREVLVRISTSAVGGSDELPAGAPTLWPWVGCCCASAGCSARAVDPAGCPGCAASSAACAVPAVFFSSSENRVLHSAVCWRASPRHAGHPGVGPCWICRSRVMYTPRGTGTLSAALAVGTGSHGWPRNASKTLGIHRLAPGRLHTDLQRMTPHAVPTRCSSDARLLPSQMPMCHLSSSLPCWAVVGGL